MRLWILVLACACGGSQPPAERPTATSCDRDWDRWRDGAIANLLRPQTRPDGTPYLDTRVVSPTAAELAGDLAACPDAPAMTNLRRFVTAYAHSEQPDHELGLAIDDRAYITSVRADIALPPVFTSQPFLQAMADPATYRDGHRMIQEASRAAAEAWTVLIYRSRFLTTPDEATYGRYFVLVPGAVDRWIQLGIAVPDRPPTKPIRSLSVVSMRATDGSYRSAIADYWRTSATDGIAVTTRVEAGEGGSNCYNCHKAAVLPIRPAATYRFADDGALVTADASDTVGALARRIRRYGPPDFGPALDTGGFGPALGPADRRRSRRELARCADDPALDQAALARVGDAMRCDDCHDGDQLGAINLPQAVFSQQDFIELRDPVTGHSAPLVDTFVGAGWMPPNAELSSAERAALVRCLKREYLDFDTGSGLLVDWLRD